MNGKLAISPGGVRQIKSRLLQIKELERQRRRKRKAAAHARKDPHAMIRLMARVMGIETADTLVNEILSRQG